MNENEFEQARREQEEKDAKRNALQNLLQQNDYMARKVVFELAEIIRAQFPDVAMPEFEKYLPAEQKAREFRTEMSELE